MSPILSLVLLPFEASKVQDYRLAPVPRNSDYKENPQGFRESSFFTKKSIHLLNNVSAHPSKAQTNSYLCSNRISFIFVRFGLE